MSARPKLSLARAPKPAKVPLSLVKQALRLFAGQHIAKATRHRNARAWIAARMRMGDKHVLKGHPVSWGRPGEPRVDQVHAPRRMRD